MTLYRHVIKGLFPGDSWSVTMHSTGTLSLAAANAALVASWTALWTGNASPTDNLNQLVATDVVCTEAVTSILDPTTGKQQTQLIGGFSLAGTSEGTSLPPQCSVGLTWRTALANKQGRGRMYLPVLSVSTADAGLLATASQTIVAKAGANLVNGLIGAGLVPSLLNRKTMVTTPITSGDVGNIFDTQRRRRNKLVEARTAMIIT
jgi:hypothetical protein